MRKRFWLENGSIYFDPLDSEVIEVGKLKDSDIQDGILIVGNMAIPLEKDDEIFIEWEKLYPIGRVVDVIDSKPPTPSQPEIDSSEMKLKIIETLTELGVI